MKTFEDFIERVRTTAGSRLDAWITLYAWMAEGSLVFAEFHKVALTIPTMSFRANCLLSYKEPFTSEEIINK